MNNRLFEISNELASNLRAQLKTKMDLAAVEVSIIAQEAHIIPEGGWPGSNADTRKAYEKQAKAADPVLKFLNEEKNKGQESLQVLELDFRILQMEKEAWQWTIKDNANEIRVLVE